MQHVDSIVGTIITISNDPARSYENKKEAIISLIKSFAADSLNLFTNIVATSLNSSDHEKRISKMCEESGLYKTGGKFY